LLDSTPKKEEQNKWNGTKTLKKKILIKNRKQVEPRKRDGGDVTIKDDIGATEVRTSSSCSDRGS
jgi:hypothetical protein